MSAKAENCKRNLELLVDDKEVVEEIFLYLSQYRAMSVTFLQRKFKMNYYMAHNIMGELTKNDLIPQKSKKKQVFIHYAPMPKRPIKTGRKAREEIRVQPIGPVD